MRRTCRRHRPRGSTHLERTSHTEDAGHGAGRRGGRRCGRGRRRDRRHASGRWSALPAVVRGTSPPSTTIDEPAAAPSAGDRGPRTAAASVPAPFRRRPLVVAADSHGVDRRTWPSAPTDRPARGRCAGRTASRTATVARRSRPRRRPGRSGPGRRCAARRPWTPAASVGLARGVPHHHVRPAVDDLPDVVGRSLGRHRSAADLAAGMARPTAPGCRPTRCGGRYAMRAVASVWPYIT